MKRFDITDINNKRLIGLRISLRSTQEIPERKLKLKQDHRRNHTTQKNDVVYTEK